MSTSNSAEGYKHDLNITITIKPGDEYRLKDTVKLVFGKLKHLGVSVYSVESLSADADNGVHSFIIKTLSNVGKEPLGEFVTNMFSNEGFTVTELTIS